MLAVMKTHATPEQIQADCACADGIFKRIPVEIRSQTGRALSNGNQSIDPAQIEPAQIEPTPFVARMDEIGKIAPIAGRSLLRGDYVAADCVLIS
jgi:hypothetical protein